MATPTRRPAKVHADYCRADLTRTPPLLDRTCHACRVLALGMSLRKERYETRPWPSERRN